MAIGLFGSMPLLAKQAVIYDTDMAIDDWSALLFLAKHPDLDLLAVTVSASGESHCDTGVANALSLLDIASAKGNIPVSCGDPYPLDGYFVFPSPWREQADTLSGVKVAKSARPHPAEHAVETLHKSVSAREGKVTVVAVGPLTNIAQWLQRYPDDKSKVARLVIMGGALDAPGNIIVPGFTDKHPNTRAEWNILVDPLAAQEVMTSGLAIELVGLDVTNQVRVTAEFAKAFIAQANNPAAQFIADVFAVNKEFIASNEYYFWDVLAAIITVEPELCGPETTPVSVGLDYTDKPAYLGSSDDNIPPQRWDGKARRHIVATNAGVISRAESGPGIQVCMHSDGKRALALFNHVISGG